MTLHKSKGLEFDLVFHLDLYNWVIPKLRPYDGGMRFENTLEFQDFYQDINLHYVGITRAKKACILCSSSKRINTQGQEKNLASSYFLGINDLPSYRKEVNT